MKNGVENKSLTVPVRKSFFSLEMTPDGVSLRLDSAFSRSAGVNAGIQDLLLTVPYLDYPFDYTSGPRVLQNHLTELQSLTVEIDFEVLARLVQGESPSPVQIERGSSESVVFSGLKDNVPWSVRAGFFKGAFGDITMKFRYPRIFVLTEIPWSRVISAMLSAGNGAQLSDSGTEIRIPLVRTVLKPLMAGLGFKLPVMDGVELSGVNVSGNRIKFRFVRNDDPVRVDLPPVDKDGRQFVPESFEPSEMLARLAASGRDPTAVMEFIEGAAGCPVLWPEILARSLELGNERPELVSAQLAVVMTGSENPGWVDDSEFLRVCRRLLVSAENEGCHGETERCAVLISSVVDRFVPADALSILDDMRSAGFETREVLEAVSVTFDRLGRHLDAATTRLRALAMVPARTVPDAVRALVDRMDVNGFAALTSQWLKELIDLGSKQRFGSASPAVHRTAVVLLASRDAKSGREGAWKMLKDMLAVTPGDPEVLELLMTLSRERHEIAEVVDLFKAAAQNSSGREKCVLLTIAGRTLNEQFGLKRKAVELLEQAFDVDPECESTAVLLDDIYVRLGRDDERSDLAWKRLSVCSDPSERIRLLSLMMNSANAAGIPDRAAVAARELLRLDPADPACLAIAENVFASVGDAEGLKDVREAMEDLGLRQSGHSEKTGAPATLDAALAAGDLDAAVNWLKTALDSTSDPELMKERLMLAADLSIMAGRHREAAGFFRTCAVMDPELAVRSALESGIDSGMFDFDSMMDAVRWIAGRSMNSDQRIRIVEILVEAGGRAFDSNLEQARPILETAVYLDPENVSATMALAAVYESTGMHSEATLVSGHG